MDHPPERVGTPTELLYRQLNERIRSAIEDLEITAASHEFMCECLLLDCRKMIALTLDQYRVARSSNLWFIVLPDHVSPAVEHAIEESDGYWIVERATGSSTAL